MYSRRRREHKLTTDDRGRTKAKPLDKPVLIIGLLQGPQARGPALVRRADGTSTCGSGRPVRRRRPGCPGGRGVRSATASAATGIVKVTRVPKPVPALSAQMRPRCASTSLWVSNSEFGR